MRGFVYLLLAVLIAAVIEEFSNMLITRYVLIDWVAQYPRSWAFILTGLVLLATSWFLPPLSQYPFSLVSAGCGGLALFAAIHYDPFFNIDEYFPFMFFFFLLLMKPFFSYHADNPNARPEWIIPIESALAGFSFGSILLIVLFR